MFLRSRLQDFGFGLHLGLQGSESAETPTKAITEHFAKLVPEDLLLVLGFEVTSEKKYKLVFHNGSLKKKVLKYGTPKPSTLKP